MKVIAVLSVITSVAQAWINPATTRLSIFNLKKTLSPSISDNFLSSTNVDGRAGTIHAMSSPSDVDLEKEYSVTLGLPPLGIVFGDIGNGYPPAGVEVIALTSGGQGDKCGAIEIGDRLKSCSAVKFVSGSSKFNIEEVDCTKFDFDTVVSALTSNNPKFGCDSVTLTFTRPVKIDEAAV